MIHYILSKNEKNYILTDRKTSKVKIEKITYAMSLIYVYMLEVCSVPRNKRQLKRYWKIKSGIMQQKCRIFTSFIFINISASSKDIKILTTHTIK